MGFWDLQDEPHGSVQAYVMQISFGVVKYGHIGLLLRLLEIL